MRGSANFLVPPRKYVVTSYILLVNHQTASSCSKIREIKFCWILRDRSPPTCDKMVATIAKRKPIGSLSVWIGPI